MARESVQANTSSQADAKRRSVNAKAFLAAFRERPNDYYLMEKYSLKPKHLRKIYDQLMERGLLVEYEYNSRDVKSPKVEQAGANPFKTRGKSAASPSEAQLHQSPASAGTSTVVELQIPEDCPNCNRSKHPDYHDSCPYCGVVFAKMKQAEGSKKVAVWVGDTRQFR